MKPSSILGSTSLTSIKKRKIHTATPDKSMKKGDTRFSPMNTAYMNQPLNNMSFVI